MFIQDINDREEDDEEEINKFENPTVRARRLKEKKARPLAINTNHVLNFESSFDQATGGNFFMQNSPAYQTHNSDHRRRN